MTPPKPKRNALPEPLLSVAELADWWGLSYDTVDQMVLSGELPAVRLRNKLVRIRLADAEAAMTPVVVPEVAAS